MGFAIVNTLLNGQAGPRANPATSPQTTLPPSPFYIPGGLTVDAEWSDWLVLIQSLQGAPTTARLNLHFEMGVATSQGDQSPPPAPATYNFSYTDVTPFWQTMTAAEYPFDLPDGDWPVDPQTSGTGAVATQATTLPWMIKRRIRGGFRHRLRVDQTFTGGTNPAFIFTVTQIQRYA